MSEMKLVETADGSKTFFSGRVDEHYHSVHGAVQESMHVFIRHGLLTAFEKWPDESLSILETGLGTGLNLFLSSQYAHLHQHKVYYHSLEPYPLTPGEARTLGYPRFLQIESRPFNAIHESAWNVPHDLNESFTYYKDHQGIFECSPKGYFHLVFLDLFSPEKEPDLWNPKMFALLYELTTHDGFFVTYCAKGRIRRMAEEAGFRVEKLPGPPGKREMIRAWKSLI